MSTSKAIIALLNEAMFQAYLDGADFDDDVPSDEAESPREQALQAIRRFTDEGVSSDHEQERQLLDHLRFISQGDSHIEEAARRLFTSAYEELERLVQGQRPGQVDS